MVSQIDIEAGYLSSESMMTGPFFAPRFACLGGGAIGSSVMARLAYLGLRGALITRTHFYSYRCHDQAGDSLTVEGFGGRWRFYRRPLAELSFEKIGLIFLAVQTYNLEHALSQIASQLSDQVVVVSLCNGKCDAILEELQRHFPHIQLRLGMAFYNCTPRSDQHYRCSEGYLVWGTTAIR